MPYLDAWQAGVELTDGGERIAVVPVQSFHFFHRGPGAWWFAGDTTSHPVEIDQDRESAISVIPVNDHLKRLKRAGLAMLGKKDLGGVSPEDIETLAEQLLRAKRTS